MTVVNGSRIISALLPKPQKNIRAIIGYFTTDAFDTITGNVRIVFGFGLKIQDTIEDVDLQNEIASSFGFLCEKCIFELKLSAFQFIYL